MADPIKRALTRRRIQRGRLITEEPKQSTVYVVKFALGMAVCLGGVAGGSPGFPWHLE
jgi:hypothetical protein